MAMCAVSRLFMTSWMVTEMMRWVTSGGTPAVDPCELILSTTSMPVATWPKSEYAVGEAFTLGAGHDEELAAAGVGLAGVGHGDRAHGYWVEASVDFAGNSSGMV